MNSFLEAVLPSQGTFCVVAIKDGKVKQRFFKSHQEVDEAAEQLDAQEIDAYFALASFDNQQSRKAENAQLVRSLFVDLDCGENKPYAEAFDAGRALSAFVEHNHLPEPIVVNSGGGLHAYWPFTQDIDAQDWLPVAKSFKDLCIEQGLAIDVAVTADVARILRVPGTHNYKKATPRPVRILTWGSDPSDFEAFKALLPAPKLDLSAARRFNKDDATMKALLGDKPKSKFSVIARKSLGDTGCAQIKHALVNASSLEEPMWRAALSVAWNCIDGEKSIHKLSMAHPDYNPEVTVEKAQRLTDKPYTCAWYKQNNPAGCAGCKHTFTSPIQLGAFVEEAKPNDDGVYVVEAPLNPDNEDTQTTVAVSIPEYPYPYFRGVNGGVFIYKQDEAGVDVPVEVYPQDLYITGRFYDSDEHGDGEGELVGINLHLPRDGVRRFHAPVVALLTKDKLRDTLVKHGVIAYGKQLDLIMGYVATSIRGLQTRAASSKTRNQMGWTSEGHFVVGELEYTPVDIKLAPPASGTRQLAPLFYQKGSLEEWSSVVNFYNTPGMENHAFAFLAGVGSSLLQLLNSTQVRGAVLNLVSNKSGTGKTTVQMAINSFFGHPSELLMAAKDTPASRFQRLGTLNSICMTVDEMTNASGEQLSALVYGSTQGRAPHRMEAQSNKLRNNNTTWCSITVTSSNAVMADALASYRSAVEGELKRVIDLHIDVVADIPKAETDALFTKLADNFGAAGPIFIQHVLANRGAVEQALQQMQAKTDKDAELSRSDRFYSAVLAVAFTAGLIGNKLGLWKLDLQRIYARALREVSMVRESNTTTVGTTDSLAMETFAKFISENVGSTLIINSHQTGQAPQHPMQTPRTNSVKLRYEPDTDEIVVSCSDLRAYFVERRVDFKASLESFKQMGALVTTNNGKELSAVRRITAGALLGMTVPAARCYVFKGRALGVNIEVPADAGDA